MTWTIHEVSDGGLDYPRESLLPSDAPGELVDSYPPVVPVPYRPILVNAGGKLVLIDTGAGPLGPGTGRLQESLRSAGFAPEDIQVVVLTHAHADHIGGLLDSDGARLFPNAEVVIGRKEFDFWVGSGIRDRLGDGSVYGNPMIECVIRDWYNRYVEPLAPMIRVIDWETEVAPGIRVIAAPGHTPGHSAVAIDGGPEPALFTGDAFALPEHVPHPEWTSSFDLDSSETVRTRYRLLDMAASERRRVIHYHVGPFGHVERRGTGYEWVAES
jgi:glyoxylase-like metal-dependent hydrolase (beta-lactamase superfamily II)